MEKPPSEPPARPVPRDDVHVATSRCPYCRDDVTPEASVACQSCLARHHVACWDEAGSCSSCSSAQRLEVAPRPPIDEARVGELLRKAGHSAEEITRFLADRNRPTGDVPTCRWVDCSAPGDWSLGVGWVPHCAHHARTARGRGVVLLALASVFFAGITAWTAVVTGLEPSHFAFPVVPIIFVMAVALATLGVVTYRSTPHPRDP